MSDAETSRKAFDKRVGDVLRAARARRGLTCEQVAEAVGTTRQNVGKYERGEQAMTLHFFSRIAPVVGLKLKDVLS